MSTGNLDCHLLRIGAVVSSGGSVLAEMIDATAGKPVSFRVATDRACGAEERCAERGVPVLRVEQPSNRDFSEQALEWLGADGPLDFIVLFFLRVVTPPLITHVPTFNIHPSLLPAFPGFNALRRTREAGARFLGATAHLVTTDVDGGPIIAQAIRPLTGGEDQSRLERLSFLQKTELSLVLCELMAAGALRVAPERGTAAVTAGLPVSDRFSPALRDPDFLRHMAVLTDRFDPQGTTG